MEQLKEWWAKRWVRNAVFLVILVVLYFTGGVQWIQTQVTRVGLSSPKVEANDPGDAKALYRYDYRMVDQQGAEVSLSAFKGKPVFINYWASWCVPCLAEFASMSALRDRAEGVAFLFITREAPEAFEKFLGKTSHDLPFYRQVSGAPNEFSSRVIPATFVLNKEGQLVYSHQGAADWNDDAVLEMLQKLVQ